MKFIADRQTLDDLNILGKYKSNSIFSIFNQVKSIGGEKLLESMFINPLIDSEQINQRSEIFRFFQEKKLIFPFNGSQLDQTEKYLNEISQGNLVIEAADVFRKKITYGALKDEAYPQMIEGLNATMKVLLGYRSFLTELYANEGNSGYGQKLTSILEMLNHPKLAFLSAVPDLEKNTPWSVAKVNFKLRTQMREQLKQVLESLYEIDVCIAVAEVAERKKMTYARALPSTFNELMVKELRHPAIENGIGNSLVLNKDSNVLFLTGANMAGKSTLMKTLGINLYLAHMGFPVAAEEMKFSVKDGIYSSINVPDNLAMGYSHFYAEVLRVKAVAKAVSENKNLLVIFDELFKGTNVKDAYDATLAISEAFSTFRNCVFIVSTHIIEVGKALDEKCKNIQFKFLPTVMAGHIPKYTYKLQPGITTDRHGMMIIENERILEIIEGENPG